MTELECDLCVIGAGSGGLSVAAGAVQMGASVVLIEAGKMGGDCLNFGCVPSKALLHGAASGMSHDEAIAHVRRTIETIAPHDSQERFEALGCTVIRARAEFVSDRVVVAGDTQIRARRFVIATGSGPAIPPIEGLSDVPYLTNETIWNLDRAPEHLIILGGGPIGVEMAFAHRRMGSEVTLIEMARILGRDDPEAVDVIRAKLRDMGVNLIEDCGAERIEADPRGVMVHLATDGPAMAGHAGSHLLVATGRRPNLEGLGLDKAGIDFDRDGVTVDRGLRTTNRRVYAIGDAAGGPHFTHVAGYHAGVVIRSALFGLPAKIRNDHIPWVTYTDPELAQVGLTEAAARERFGRAVEVARFTYAQNDRAIATQSTVGFIKVVIVKGRPVGATIVGAEAGEQIGLWALALANRLKMSQVAAMIAPYPTMAEISKRAAGAYFSPRLFDSARVKRVVGLVQRWLP